MNILATPNQLPDLAEATERANKWIDVARPIIRAMFALEEIESTLRQEAYREDDKYRERTFREAVSSLVDPQRDLNQMLDGIRDDFLCDECPPQPPQDADEGAWEERDEFNDVLGESVTTVEQAIRIVTDEHNRSFGI